MLKRTTAYIFILLANIVLLAHAVLPHHHHQSIACVEEKHCQDDNIVHKHNTAENSHQHDGNSSASCILKQAILLPSNQGKQETECVNCSDNHSHDFLYVFSYFETEALKPNLYITASIPDISFSYTSYLTTSLGLRAPPTV